MKDKNHKLSLMKHRLREKEKQGVEEVKWKLDEEQREYLTRAGYSSEPYLFRITTRTIADVSKSGSKLLKEIDHAKKNSKRELYKPLNVQQQELLKKYHVHYVPYKFRLKTSRIQH